MASVPLKVLTVFGTRPEAVKLAPVVRAMAARPDRFTSRVCVTAQHRQMLDQVLRLFRIRPHHDLDIMTPGQTLAQVTARAVAGLDAVLAREKPDVVLVQGDTTTALCGALSAFYRGVRVGHVEAGLRTGDLRAPFPEEANRRLVTRLADWHFAPTPLARRNLLEEGVPAAAVHVTGNTVIDALSWVRREIRRAPPPLPAAVARALSRGRVVLVTGHRRESFGKGFENICRAIRSAADAHPDAAFVYPVHMNPQVRGPVRRILGGHPGIFLLDPLPYGPFVRLMAGSRIVLTDSGGVQEEAPSLGKPVLVMRETTERPEGVRAGNALVVGTSEEGIRKGLESLLSDDGRRRRMAAARNPYGDGKSSGRILDVLWKEGRNR